LRITEESQEAKLGGVGRIGTTGMLSSTNYSSTNWTVCFCDKGARCHFPMYLGIPF